jgi:hypothetical protein
MNSIFFSMLSVIYFGNVHPFSWPQWIQTESCYERIVICERYDSSDPTCSNQAGHLSSNGFRIIGRKNEVEIEGRSVIYRPNGGLFVGGSVWKTTIGLTEGTSSLTTTHNIDLIDCPARVTVTVGATIKANYTFLCENASEVVEPTQTGIVLFKGLGICSNSQFNVLLIAVRQGNDTKFNSDLCTHNIIGCL